MNEREEFLARRRLGIGGSDAPIVLGLSPDRSPLDLYAEKIGKRKRDPLAGREEVEIGRIIEDSIARLFVERTGLPVRRRRAQAINRDFPFVRAHVDRVVADPKRGSGVLEIKNRDRFALRAWEEPTDDPTTDRSRTEIQVQHNLLATGLDFGLVAVLFGGNRFRIFPVERNDAFLEVLLDVEIRFWKAVETRTPPDLSSNVFADRRALDALFPAPTRDEPIELPPEAVRWDRERRLAGQAIARLERIRERAGNRLRAAIGEHAVGVLPGGAGYRYERRRKTIAKKLDEIAPSIRDRCSKEIRYRELRYTKKAIRTKKEKGT